MESAAKKSAEADETLQRAQAPAKGRSLYEVRRAILLKLGGKLTVYQRPFDEDSDGLQV